MSAFGQTELERLRYWQGQMLRSRDFRDQDALDARRRLLHNRSLHRASGVCFGLGVTVDKADASLLVVDCGLAYDCAGRELILQRPRRVPAPDRPATLVLRRRAASRENSCCPTTGPGCDAEGLRDIEQDTELVWQTDISVESVPIAKITVAAGAAAIDTTFRPPAARAMARLRLARGETVRGNTPWENWEVAQPDGKGGFTSKVVGVQTHIDTSAAGFTDIPTYFASLTGPEWDLAKSEFAPTFFPQVAEPSVDGFIFRLLMAETGRRRYNALAGTARVSQVTRQAGDQMRIEVDSATAFRKNDRVTLLRPRGDAAYFVTQQDGLELTLHTALLENVTPGRTVLAVGNVPRVANIASFSGNPAVLVPYESVAALKRNDILVRFADRAATTISASSAASGAKVLTVRLPFAAWKKEEPVGFALTGASTAVDTADAAADGSKITLKLKQADPAIKPGATLVLLNGQKKLLSSAALVLTATGTSVDISVPAGLGALADLKLVSPVRADITILDVKPQASGMTVNVTPPGLLQEGDYVAATNNLNAVTVIDRVDESGQELTLRDTLNLAGVSSLAAANWITATTVNLTPSPSAPLKIVVGRAGAVVSPCFVVRVDGVGMSNPALVKDANGTDVLLDTPIAGLARLDTLAVGAFPRIVTVAVQQDATVLMVQEPDALRAGDILVRLTASAAPVPLVDVVFAGGSLVQLRRSLGTLAPGEQLGVVQFRDTTVVMEVAATGEVTVDHEINARDGDFVALLTHYVGNSSNGVIQDIAGNLITLAPGGVLAGDGILPRDRIDGGILGPASVSFPDQPLVRLESTEGLADNSGRRQDTVIGFDLVTGQFRSAAVRAFVVDSFLDGVANGTVNRVFLFPTDFAQPFLFRPETLSLITTFNADFPSAFATFAQVQKLYVCWTGCQPDPRPTFGCPGEKDVPKPCNGNNSGQD